jgi:tRNA-2-methylthio-N6-dimethylallyladenosine synthase
MEQLEIKKQKEFIKKVKEININKELKYYILTMGCSLNENDSEKICGMLEEMRYQKTENQNNADIIIFNTCCIRENAEDKLFGKLGEVKKVHENRGTIIAIGGCMMQEKHILEKLNKSYPYVDIIFGTHTLHKLPEDIFNILENNTKIEDILDIDGRIYENLPIKRTDSVKAQVTIMYGCNNFCSYCIVPYVRGRERSRKSEDILNEIKDLAKNGYKEIMLLGQNVNSYNGGENYNFANLLKDINEINGIEIIRFISPHPKDFTDDVIEAIANSSKVSKCIHLPLQSGSTNVLKSMNRKYTKEQYLELVDKMKRKIPNLSLTTDIIVGFPGETEEDFEDTLDVVKKVGFEQVFMFIYSRRRGTVADEMKNQIPEDIKHKRFDRLKELVEKQIEENNDKYVGTTQKILIDGKSKNNEDKLSGRTTSNKVVIIDADESYINKLINVKIVENCKWYLRGEIE